MDFISHVKSCAVEAFNQANPEILITEEDVYVVWFSKTLQNWKALVSTNKLHENDYCEVTHNGDKNETYCDVYNKVLNIKLPF